MTLPLKMRPVNKIMDKTLKTILIFLIAIFGAGFLSVLPTNATLDPLVVEYSSNGGTTWSPLSGSMFSETNFLPGNDVTRLIRVTNNSGETQRIAAETINESDPDNFSSQLNLTIKEGATAIFDDTLKKFFDQGETYLSSLAAGAQTQYDLTIDFTLESGNDYQEKALGFDMLVGFEGTEGGLPLPPQGGGTGGSGGGGDGGGLPPGLTITNETDQIITDDSVTIVWNTSYFSTSQVIYGAEGENHILDLTDNSLTPPKYGYEHTTPEYDISPKITFHSVTITGLTPGTTYYYRSVSHGSLAISTEHSFTTLREGEVKITEESAEAGVAGPGGEIIAMTGAGTSEGVADDYSGSNGANSGGSVSGEKNKEEPATTQGGDGLDPKMLLASIGDTIGDTIGARNSSLILILSLLALIIFYFFKKKRLKKVQ